MEMQNVPNSKELKVFVKGAFVLIGLIFVLAFGVVALLLHFDRNIEISKNINWMVFTLILVLIILPILVFFRFSCLMKSHYKNLYGYSNNEGFISKMQKLEIEKLKVQKIEALIESCFTAIKTIKPDSENNLEALLKKLKKIINLLSKWKGNNGCFYNGGGI